MTTFPASCYPSDFGNPQSVLSCYFRPEVLGICLSLGESTKDIWKENNGFLRGLAGLRNVGIQASELLVPASGLPIPKCSWLQGKGTPWSLISGVLSTAMICKSKKSLWARQASNTVLSSYLGPFLDIMTSRARSNLQACVRGESNCIRECRGENGDAHVRTYIEAVGMSGHSTNRMRKHADILRMDWRTQFSSWRSQEAKTWIERSAESFKACDHIRLPCLKVLTCKTKIPVGELSHVPIGVAPTGATLPPVWR